MQLKSENSSQRQMNAHTRTDSHSHKTFAFAMIVNGFVVLVRAVHQRFHSSLMI